MTKVHLIFQKFEHNRVDISIDEPKSIGCQHLLAYQTCYSGIAKLFGIRMKVGEKRFVTLQVKDIRKA